MVLPESVRKNPWLCANCKGVKHLCGMAPCPLIEEAKRSLQVATLPTKTLFGSSPPSTFVGEAGYPCVYAGPLLPNGRSDTELFEKPSQWLELDFSKLISMRVSLIRSVKRMLVRRADETRVGVAMQEAAMSVKPVDLELLLSKPPSGAPSFSFYTPPLGPSAKVERVLYVENPKVPKAVERVVSDRQLKAVEGLVTLWESGFDEVYLTRLLSSALLGVKRSLVPTRWSITAIDDTLSKAGIKKLKEFKTLDRFLVGKFEALGNRFAVILSPFRWRYEMLESWLPFVGVLDDGSNTIPSDSEDGWGRSSYASGLGGAYYAARLAVVEALLGMKRQAEVIVFMEVTKGWLAPLGVWRVREGVRRCFQNVKTFSSLKEAFEEAISNMETHKKSWYRSSRFLRERLSTKTLEQFFTGYT
jgi:hypothetical protein